MPSPLPPTDEIYPELQRAYDFFNAELFEQRLPYCLITLQREKNFLGYFYPQRFASSRRPQRSDEIAMNPAAFASRSTEEVLSTLAHEMVHLEQSHFGKPGRRGYHNRAWGVLMKRIGLHPSATGMPGGAEIGERMTHFIVENGAFIIACRKLIGSGFSLSWYDYRQMPVLRRLPPPQPALSAAAEADDEDEDDDSPELSVDTTLPRAAALSAPPVDASRLDVEFISPIIDRSNRVKYQCPNCDRADPTNVWGRPGLNVVCGKHGVRLVPV